MKRRQTGSQPLLCSGAQTEVMTSNSLFSFPHISTQTPENLQMPINSRRVHGALITSTHIYAPKNNNVTVFLSQLTK